MGQPLRRENKADEDDLETWELSVARYRPPEELSPASNLEKWREQAKRPINKKS
jgi:hypothetical protein